MIKIYRKLVRDRIPAIIKADGMHPVMRKLTEKKFKEEVLKKIIEEAEEIHKANSHKELIKEFADLHEIVATAMSAHRISSKEVQKIRAKRHKERGGFKKRVFLEKVE